MNGNRIAAAIGRTREKLAASERLDGTGPLDPTALPALEAGLANSTSDWVAYQKAQSTAHAMGVISTDEAQTIYIALGGEAPGPGGWAEHADLATKVVVTNVLAELVALRLRGAA